MHFLPDINTAIKSKRKWQKGEVAYIQ